MITFSCFTFIQQTFVDKKQTRFGHHLAILGNGGGEGGDKCLNQLNNMITKQQHQNVKLIFSSILPSIME